MIVVHREETIDTYSTNMAARLNDEQIRLDILNVDRERVYFADLRSVLTGGGGGGGVTGW